MVGLMWSADSGRLLQVFGLTSAWRGTLVLWDFYFTLSRVVSISVLLQMSTFRMDGGTALVRPVPTAFQPSRWKALST